MSPNSNMGINEIISWKGRTFNQISSTILKNNTVSADYNIGNSIFRKGRALNIYRREIVIPSEPICDKRTGISIDILNAPGGSITNSSINEGKSGGLVNLVDFNLTENTSERPGSNCDNECTSFGNTQSNALRRLRSGGMIKKQFDLSTDKPTYYTSSQQYINGRNKGFTQNQYYYIQTGNSSAKPGDSLSTNNMYASNTLTNCKKFYISTATSFQYIWVNEPTIVGGENTTPPATVTVNVPVGYYDVEDINSLLHNTMTTNLHYYQRLDNKTKVYLLNFALNGTTGNIELAVSPISESIVTTNSYNKAYETTELGVVETSRWSTPTTPATPQITIDDNDFKSVIGFDAGTYPATNTNTTTETFVSTASPLIKTRYNRVYYKPNNPQFAQQGAVTSGSKIARIKYDTITTAAASYTNVNVLGRHVANALAYNVPANGYTIKDKLGYPNKNTPIVTSTGEMRFCR